MWWWNMELCAKHIYVQAPACVVLYDWSHIQSKSNAFVLMSPEQITQKSTWVLAFWCVYGLWWPQIRCSKVWFCRLGDITWSGNRLGDIAWSGSRVTWSGVHLIWSNWSGKCLIWSPRSGRLLPDQVVFIPCVPCSSSKFESAWESMKQDLTLLRFQAR